jgi:hypothetical protein
MPSAVPGPRGAGRRLQPEATPARGSCGTEAVEGLGTWAETPAAIPDPKRADQDQLDAVLCALIGLLWQTAPRAAAIMIGDRTFGYAGLCRR